MKTSKMIRISKLSLKQVYPSYIISYTNVRNLRANIPEVKLHHFKFKPDLLLMPETGINRTEGASNLGLLTPNS